MKTLMFRIAHAAGNPADFAACFAKPAGTVRGLHPKVSRVILALPWLPARCVKEFEIRRDRFVSMSRVTMTVEIPNEVIGED